MNRPNFTELVATLKGRSSKGVRFKPAKPRNFDRIQDWKVIDVWFVEMEDYLHVTKVGRHLVMEFAQSYLKGYAFTWWRTMKQEERKTHGYTLEFFKQRTELEFIPNNFDYISRCKLRDLVNVTNDNLQQYVKAYFELDATPLLEECEDDTHTPEMGNWESSETPETSKFHCKGQSTSP